MTVVGSVRSETTRVSRWLTATLATDTTIISLIGANNVHSRRATPGAHYPLIIHQMLGAADVRGSGPYRIMTNGLWLVKAVGETRDILDLEPIADRIDELLQAGSGTAADGIVLSSVREYPFELDEHENGKDFLHLGGAYRCLAQIPTY